MTEERRTLLVIGGSGYLGRAIAGAAVARFDVRATHRSRRLACRSIRFDVFEDDPVSLLANTNPDVVIIAAHIEPSLVNTDAQMAAEGLLQACARHRVVYISSDAVFDGRRGCYGEDDEPVPIKDYGRGLAFMEAAVRRSCPNNLIVRPSYLYGYAAGILDSRLATTQERLLQGETVRLFDDMFKSPMEVNQAARLILDLGAMPYVGTVHVAGPRMSVFDFHREAMIALGVPADRLQAESMPDEPGLQRDTSLSVQRLHDLTETMPKSVDESLRPK